MTTLVATYDDALSRVRLAATGLSGSAVAARFEWSPDSIAWSIVRGGTAVTVASTAASLDHYEFNAMVTNRYRVIELDSAGAQLATTTISAGAPMNRVWLKVPSAPYANLRVRLTGWSDIERASRSGTFAIQGRRDPVAVTELHGSRKVTVSLRAEDDVETTALDLVLRLGRQVHLHVPPQVALPSIHAVVGTYTWNRPTPTSHVGRFQVPLVECAPPDVMLAAPTVTWATIANRYATWADVAAAHSTWASLLTLQGSAIDALEGS